MKNGYSITYLQSTPTSTSHLNFAKQLTIIIICQFSSVKQWYYPLASRLDLYRSAHDLLKLDYKYIPEFSLYYDSCLKWTINPDGFTLHGYNGKTRHLKSTPVSRGVADFKSEWSQGTYFCAVNGDYG